MLQQMNKKGVSIMVGYVLLIVLAVVIATITYQGLKTYLPQEKVECPDDVSIFIKESLCEVDEITGNRNLSITLQNKGLFDIAGYFISATKGEEDIATFNLVPKFNENHEGSDGEKFGDAIVITIGLNKFSTGSEARGMFDLLSTDPPTTSITVTPVRYQEENRKLRFVTCGKLSINEKINCA